VSSTGHRARAWVRTQGQHQVNSNSGCASSSEFYKKRSSFMPAGWSIPALGWTASNNKWLVAGGRGAAIMNPPRRLGGRQTAKRGPPIAISCGGTDSRGWARTGRTLRSVPILGASGNLLEKTVFRGKKSLAGAHLSTALRRRRKWLWAARVAAMNLPGRVQLRPIQGTWAEERAPKGTLYHSPPSSTIIKVPFDCGVSYGAAKMRSRFTRRSAGTKHAFVRYMQGEPLEKTHRPGRGAQSEGLTLRTLKTPKAGGSFRRVDTLPANEPVAVHVA